MHIEICGTAQECAEMPVALRACLDVELVAVSPIEPHHGDDGQARVWIQARLRGLDEQRELRRNGR